MSGLVDPRENVAARLEKAIVEFERAATEISNILIMFDLKDIPYCERDLNTVDIGCKALVAKKLLSILSKQTSV